MKPIAIAMPNAVRVQRLCFPCSTFTGLRFATRKTAASVPMHATATHCFGNTATANSSSPMLKMRVS